MSMNIRPDYINPLTMLNKKAVPQLGRPAARQTEQVSELRTKQQQLQNQVLLLKASGTDSAGATAETRKALEAELEKVSARLRTAKADPSQIPQRTGPLRPNRDLYEPGRAEAVLEDIIPALKHRNNIL